ncbi:MAG: type II secretion system protein [bacterium]|nr:type II secretion system protein [bacterium]
MRKALPRFTQQRGFTLIELLVALTIVTILAVSVYVALNPAQRLKDSKDARRSADVDTILSAIHQSIVDNKGTSPSNMPAAGTEVQLGTDVTGCAVSNSNCTIAAAACEDLMTGSQNLSKYLASMPLDPGGGTAGKTGYSVVQDSNGIVTIKACSTDGSTVISVSR